VPKAAKFDQNPGKSKCINRLDRLLVKKCR
jgi:hypothetical protein